MEKVKLSHSEKSREWNRKYAESKLQKLMSDDTMDFGARFMHFDEYKKMIETNTIEPREAWNSARQEYFGPRPNFRKYITNPNWGLLIDTQTNWDGPDEDYSMAELMQMCLEEAHKRAKITGEINNVRSGTLEHLKKILTEYADDPHLQHHPNLRWLKDRDNPKSEWRLMEQFLEDPASFTRSRLRTLYSEIIRTSSTAKDDPSYQVLVIYHPAALGEEGMISKWHYLNDWTPPSFVLGAAAVLPLKGLCQDMIQLVESSSLDIAHPIFDSRGIVRFPKRS